MTDSARDITADAIALQERDEFREQGWLKLIAPAKVNLHLAIGPRQADGYHKVDTVLHTLMLHDVVYMRKPPADAQDAAQDAAQHGPVTRMIACGDVEVPDLPSEDNIATKAVQMLAQRLGREDASMEIRIEKNIPAQAGLAGGSSNAAAVLVGAAHLWDISPDNPVIEEVACALGSDVAFFLRGGCAQYKGAGDIFVRALDPSKEALALVKPAAGVSTALAYQTFDESPYPIPDEIQEQVSKATAAHEVELFNNLAPASETLMPQLKEIRQWLASQPGVKNALLCGSGATTFAVCSDFAAACSIVAEARRQGLWARATSFGSIKAMVIST